MPTHPQLAVQCLAMAWGVRLWKLCPLFHDWLPKSLPDQGKCTTPSFPAGLTRACNVLGNQVGKASPLFSNVGLCRAGQALESQARGAVFPSFMAD